MKDPKSLEVEVSLKALGASMIMKVGTPNLEMSKEENAHENRMKSQLVLLTQNKKDNILQTSSLILTLWRLLAGLMTG